MEHNMDWHKKMMDDDAVIVNLGRDPAKGGEPLGRWYGAELGETERRNYPVVNFAMPGEQARFVDSQGRPL
jgi:hypothetical protein